MSLSVETENVISSGVDETNRRVFFGRYLPNVDSDEGNDFNQVSTEYAIRAIHKMITLNPKKPIEIYMSSYGGDPYSMLYLHDLILSSPCQFKFYGGGAIMSAATWIMVACDERHLHKNTTVLVHKGSTGHEGNLTDVEISMEEEKRLQELLEEIYANNSRMPKSFWSEICKRDVYLTAEEAIILGLADKIIEPKRRGEFRKMRSAVLNEKIHHNTIKKTISDIYKRIQVPFKLKDIVINMPREELIDETPAVEQTVSVEAKIEEKKEPTDGIK